MTASQGGFRATWNGDRTDCQCVRESVGCALGRLAHPPYAAL